MTRELDLRIAEWSSLAFWIADDYYLPGGDPADLRQEALLGLLEGLRDFDASHGVTLRTFLNVTIRRKVITAIKTANRLKHQPLSGAVRQVELDGETVDVVDTFADPCGDPHDALVARLELREIIDRLPSLSEAEQCAIVGFALGATYRELNRRPTYNKAAVGAVDNAFARGRRKLLAAIEAA